MIIKLEGFENEKKAEKKYYCLACRKEVPLTFKYCSDACKDIANFNFKKKRVNENKLLLKRLQEERRILKKIDFNLRNSITRSFYRFLKYDEKDEAIAEILGYTFEDLKKHLESKFEEGMSWDNWGFYGWHIDHITPLSRFHIVNLEEFKKAWALSNLQPLWAYDNLSKHNKTMEEYLKCQI